MDPGGVKALFAGSFDPPTRGHQQVIRLARAVFPELLVGIAENPEKRSFFPLGDRLRLLEELVKPSPGVQVVSYTGLTARFSLSAGVSFLVRGLRHEGDLALEKELAFGNETLARSLGGEALPTVFFLAPGAHAGTSSHLVRGIIRAEGIEAALPFLPEELHAMICTMHGGDNHE